MLKNVLITGGAGYIGSHTARSFLDKGHGVVVVDDLSAGHIEAVPAGAEFVKMNIHNSEELIEIIRQKNIDAVIHFAAKIIIPESLLHPLDYYSNNTGGVLSVLHACKSSGIDKFVFSSTAAVYGDAGAELITEDFPVGPINPYGHSKYFSERIIRECGAAYGMGTVILRYFNVAGAAHDISNGQRSKVSTHLIKLAAQTAVGVTPFLKLTGTDFPTEDGTGVRDYIHVEDLADLHVLAFKYLENGNPSEIFNCGYGQGYSVRQVIETMKKVSRKDFKVVETQRRPGDAAILVASNEKIKKAFNWTPKRNDLELICRSAYLWEEVWQKNLHTNKERKELNNLRTLESFLTPETFVAKAPGRINLIGEHTDYNDGFVLPAAINRYVYTTLTPRKDKKIKLHSLDFKDTHELSCDKIYVSQKKWANYILGVIAQFEQRGYKHSGFDLHFTGDLPMGGGLSSSAAVECSVAIVMNEWLQAGLDKISLAKMCQLAEHTFAGVRCGIMDQFACLFGKKDHVIKLDCRSLEHEYLPFKEKGVKILLFNSNIKHSLANSEYNLRHQQCAAALTLLSQAYCDVKSLRDVNLQMLQEILKKSNKTLYDRSLYVVEENSRVLNACEDLKKNDLKSFGEKMFLTHEGLSQKYAVSCTELDFLVAQVRRFPEVLGARMMGAGFGGCTLNLIQEEAASEITNFIKKIYREKMKRDLGVHEVKIENGSTIIRHPFSRTNYATY